MDGKSNKTSSIFFLFLAGIYMKYIHLEKIQNKNKKSQHKKYMTN